MRYNTGEEQTFFCIKCNQKSYVMHKEDPRLENNLCIACNNGIRYKTIKKVRKR